MNIVGGILLLASIPTLLWAFVLVRAALAANTFCDRGPFRLVRHPIYACSHFALIGLIFVIRDWWLFLVLAMSIPVAVFEARSDERTLRKTLPGYDAYARRTAAVIPFLF